MRVLRRKGANTVSEAKISQNFRRIRAKLSESDVRQIRERYHRGERPSDIAVDFPQVAKSTVKCICRGITWRDIVVVVEES
jgi:hypothetical protein